ncbi:MFS general substrate transporter [Sarocladium strictum]
MDEKIRVEHNDVEHAAQNGQAATDRYGQSLIQFDAKAESRLRLKIDLYIIPTVALLYMFCFIDRANIGNARLAGLEEDLGLTGYDYNIVVTMFYVSYIIFEIPSNLCCKWVGPGWFLPTATLLFGVASLGTAFVHTLGQCSAVRFILGIFEAGMLPGIAYYMSRWYRRSELVFRLSLYIVTAPIAGAFGGLLASAILTLDSFGSLTRWRMIFAIEGIITIGLAIISFFTLTDRPETARWLSAEEKELAISRVKSERVGTTEVLEKMDKTKIWRGILCPVTLSTSVIFLFNNVTVQGLAFFAPTVVRSIYSEATVIQQQLYTVPPYVVGAFFTVLFPWISWRIDKRQIFFAICAPMGMLGYCMFLGTTNTSVRYAATFFIASACFAMGALTNAQVSANVVSDTARSSAIGMNVMMGNIGGLIASWSFLPGDGPDYHIGNGLNLATNGMVLCLSLLTLFWMKRDNKVREKRDVDQELTGLSAQEISDLDWKHPAFRWKP